MGLGGRSFPGQWLGGGFFGSGNSTAECSRGLFSPYYGYCTAYTELFLSRNDDAMPSVGYVPRSLVE